MKQGAAFWAPHVAAVNRDGISTQAYAKRHAISVKCLYYWQSKLKSMASTVPATPAAKFVTLRMIAEGAPSSPSGSCVLVLATGVRLELAALPAPEWLASFALAVREH